MRQQLKEALEKISHRLPGLLFMGICDAETAESLALVGDESLDALSASAVLGDMLTQQSWALEALGGRERVGKTLDLVLRTRNMSLIVAPLDDVRCYMVLALRNAEYLDLARSLIRESSAYLSWIIAGRALVEKQEALSC
ncbi:MAG: hypothetical protein ABIM46_05355 [candidate division WOR-3 bacterium]